MPQWSAARYSSRMFTAGVRRPEDLRAHVLGPGHGHHHQGVALELADRGHAVAEHLVDPVGDLLEHLGGVGRGVDAPDQLGESLQRLR